MWCSCHAIGDLEIAAIANVVNLEKALSDPEQPATDANVMLYRVVELPPLRAVLPR